MLVHRVRWNVGCERHADRLCPFEAGLPLGLVVAFWHTPAFLLSGGSSPRGALWPFFLGVVAISVILTPMTNAARGSLLMLPVPRPNEHQSGPMPNRGTGGCSSRRQSW